MINYKKLIGDNIRKIRKAKGMPSQRLAESLQVSSSYISRIEGGDAVPSVESLFNIASELGVNIVELFVQPEPVFDSFRIRDHERGKFAQKDMGDYKCTLLSRAEHTAQTGVFPYLIEYASAGDCNAREIRYRQHPGWETVILVSGKLKISFCDKYDIDTVRATMLEYPFDMATFDSVNLHAYIPEGEAKSINILPNHNKLFEI